MEIVVHINAKCVEDFASIVKSNIVTKRGLKKEVDKAVRDTARRGALRGVTVKRPLHGLGMPPK